MMKNRPIAIQILFTFIVFILFLLAGISIWLPIELKIFFTNEAFETIKLSQKLFISRFEGQYYKDFIQPDLMLDFDDDNLRKVNHIIVRGDKTYLIKYPDPDVLKKMIEEGRNQKEESKSYNLKTDNNNMFYVISKTKIYEIDSLIISYLTENYTESLSKTLFSKIIIISIFSVVFAWIPALILAKRISKPIEILEKNVQLISKDIKQEVLKLDRKDEIGRLSNAIEELRLELIRKDEAEKNFIQNVSHEMKTPIMVIESYTEALKDEIYPKGDLKGSIDTILDESRLLKDKVSNLLMYNRLEFLKGHNLFKENLRLDKLIEENITRFKAERSDIEVKLNLEEVEFEANKESILSLIENLLDNQFRYAKSLIEIECLISENEVILSFFNDGPEIEGDISKIFERFKKGPDGRFGLGLAVVKSVCENEGFTIEIENKDGVKFVFKKNYRRHI